MAVLQYRTISNRTVAALAVERDTVFWDRQLKDFGVRVYPTGPCTVRPCARRLASEAIAMRRSLFARMKTAPACIVALRKNRK